MGELRDVTMQNDQFGTIHHIHEPIKGLPLMIYLTRCFTTTANEDGKVEKIPHLIIVLNSDNQKLIPSDSKDLEAIDVKFTSDLEVPHAQSIFTMPSKGVEISIAYFTKT
ncbi:hypothetical protein CY34DRAFT_109172 [Suillus luteus UH-Slu-Lm8-n1]|uniref:Uncharacterized protein n=1 Tax=Suillus luteus UH-Slu-Lm8-n1 TaxID=930992 RepID=A0A0D0AZL2_9AGAM|nr:hypothetical protein CY34DRAFT_109172 [Suillus luteus UH-Slu-Lm8-n1]